MYSTCLYCTRDLGHNDVLETLPIGRRVAFDAANGRLWVVCRSCAKWNLVPFDTRLETIDACERLFRDTRTRYSTDNIGLARAADGLDLVRIGAPQRPEFASWRYGDAYRRRRRVALAGTGLGVTAPVVLSQFTHLISTGSLAASVGLMLVAQLGPGAVGELIARRRAVRVMTSTGEPLALSNTRAQTAAVSWDESRLVLRVVRKFSQHDPYEWSGEQARLVTRRVLGRINRMAGSRRHIRDAVELMGAQSGQLAGWLYWMSKASWREKGRHRVVPLLSGASSQYWRKNDKSALPMSTLTSADRLAVEMWLSEEDEARALSGELALLARQWQEAEQLAKIADSLALPDPSDPPLSST